MLSHNEKYMRFIIIDLIGAGFKSIILDIVYTKSLFTIKLMNLCLMESISCI